MTPTFPWLGPLGLLPLPSKWIIQFGDPVSVPERQPGGSDEAELSRRIVRRGSTSGRSDDQLHVLRQRFAVYREATLPVVDHYAACGKLWRINGARGVDAVWADTRRCLEEGGAKAAAPPCKVECASPRRALGVLA